MSTKTIAASVLAMALGACAVPARDSGGFCAADRPTRPQGAPSPTWHRDVAPIVEAFCVRCHREGGLAGDSFESYLRVFAARESVARSVRARTMPPYLAAPCCARYRHSWGLSDEQIATVLDWVDAGAPEGSPMDRGARIEPPTAGLSRRDVSLSVTEPYAPTPPRGSTDDVRCFVLDWPGTARTFVTGLEIESADRSLLHHVIVASVSGEDADRVARLDRDEAGAGFSCNDGAGSLRGVTMLGGGLIGGDFPEGIGIAVEPRSKIILNIHYSTVAARPGAVDRPSVHFRTDANARPAEPLALTNPAWLIGDAMRVRAGDRDATFFYRYRPRVSTRGRTMFLRSVTPHMHTFGSRLTVRVLRANGERACVLEIPRWRFGWEQVYWLEESIRLDPDDELYLECHFDNSADNQPVPGAAPRDFTFGGNSQDMCAAFLSMTEAAR
ncbi:MAG: hypothetical protein JNK05_21615 [Myxococcales bacterium]|nr:hypothetical protein [Myxococcales bacterium]